MTAKPKRSNDAAERRGEAVGIAGLVGEAERRNLFGAAGVSSMMAESILSIKADHHIAG